MVLENALLATALKAFTLGGANRAGILAPAVPRALNDETPTINLQIIRIGHRAVVTAARTAAAAAATVFSLDDEYTRARHSYTLPPPRLSERA